MKEINELIFGHTRHLVTIRFKILLTHKSKTKDSDEIDCRRIIMKNQEFDEENEEENNDE